MTEKLRVAIRKFGPFESAIQKQFASYQAATGSALELEYEALDLNPLVERLFAWEGLKDGTWDIALIVTDWLAEAVEGGHVADLAPMLRANPIPGYPDDYAPILTRSQRFGNAIYGLPYHDGPECFIYRTDWFADPAEQTAFRARYGYPLAVPKTWKQFEEIARFFTRPKEGRYGTIFAAFPDGHNTVYDFCLQLWSRGGELTDAKGTIQLHSPTSIRALDFYRRVVSDRGLTPGGPEQIDSVQSGERFAAGSIAMMINWFGFAAVCEQPGCPVKGKVAVAPLPAGEGSRTASLVVSWLLAIGSGSPHTEEAYAFLRHCATPAMDKLTTLEGGIGCRLSTWDDPEVNAQIPFYHRLAELHEYTRELPRSRNLPKLVQVIDDAVQRAITTTEPSEDILRRAQSVAASIRL